MSYRVAEINPAYDFIPSDEFTTDRTGEMEQTRKGPGWIYVSNKINTYIEAVDFAAKHYQKTGRKTRIDTITELCLPQTNP